MNQPSKQVRGHKVTVSAHNGTWQYKAIGPFGVLTGPLVHKTREAAYKEAEKDLIEAEKANPALMQQISEIKAQKDATLKQKQDEYACRRAAMTPEERQKEDDESYLRGKGLMKFWNRL